MDINNPQNLYHVPENVPFHCYIVNITAEHGFWQSENPLTQALPLLAWQLSVVIIINRILYYLLKPFGVPRIVTDVISGILIGPSALSKTHFFAVVFPLRSIYIVETVAYWALTCHLFLTGLEIDMTTIFQVSKQAIRFAVIGTILPFIMGVGLFFISISIRGGAYKSTGSIFWGAALAVTSYPVVARILTDQKLQHIDIGRLAISIAIMSELFTWVIVSGLIPARVSLLNAVFSFTATAAFVGFCIVVVRPCLRFLIRKSTSENKYSEYYLCFILVSVSFFSLASDMLGTTSIVGAFVFGIIIPSRVLASALLDKFDDFITAYLLPLFFASLGIRLNIWSISNWFTALVMIILFCGTKMLSIFMVAHLYGFPRQDGFALGALMNSKGILALIMLQMGFDKSILVREDYVTIVISIIIMTAMAPPIISSIYNPNRRLSQYKIRTVQKGRTDSEFRILACFQSNRNVPGMISILDCSNPTKESPLSIFALHLVELTGRASAMVIVHHPNKSNNRGRQYSEQIISSLETYANLNDLVTIHPLTALSPFASMHEDICSLAEDKEVGLLILPFHKLPTSDGKLEEEGSTSFRGVNLNVLSNAPCSVGVLVDRGFGERGESNLTMRQIAMFFLGGSDDREALSYAWRMATGPGVCLTVVRFIPGDRIEEYDPEPVVPQTQSSFSTVDISVKTLGALSYIDKQKRLDNEFVDEFRLKTAGEEHMKYHEKIVNNDEELIQELKELHHIFDLYIVGRSEGVISPLTSGLLDWCEYPELGAMGDLLVTSTFAQGSVLVVQQYTGYDDEESEDEDEADGTNSVVGSVLEGSRARSRENFSDWRPDDNDSGTEMKPFQNKIKGHHHSDERV